MLRKTLLALSLIVVIIIVGFAFVFILLPQLQINGLIHVPPDTHLVYQTETRWGANLGVHSDYYLSSTDTNGLSNWYKNFYPSFRSGSPQHEWFITVKATDDRALNYEGINAGASAILGHESLCDYHYGSSPCVTIFMVDLSLQEPLNLVIAASDFAPEQGSPLYNALDSLPKMGTLVIYRYFVFDS